ncbi:MAG: hypothetical protein U9Q99_02415 [Nanoarchaeota archaeon]|nr:hypothetical protein [Nanoarchaeota archaeon]
MSTNTVVLLIISVLVLVFLILGFTMGWSKIAPFIKSSNVDTIVNNCEAACSIQNEYDFCRFPRELKDAEGEKFTTSCVVFSKVSQFSKYGIKECNIDCDLNCEDVKINEVAGDSTLTVEDLPSYDLSPVIVNKESCFIS